MGDKFSEVKEVIADKLNFPKEIILNLPKITIIGEMEIYIENHQGIVLFEEEEIRISTSIGTIIVKGMNLEILFLAGSILAINGNLKAIVFETNE